MPQVIDRYYTGLATVDVVGGWSRRLMDSLGDAGLGKEDLAAAIREHVKLLKKFEADVGLRFKQGICGETDALAATYFRLEAEQRLAEAEGGPA